MMMNRALEALELLLEGESEGLEEGRRFLGRVSENGLLLSSF
jgi:hypothetical protein